VLFFSREPERARSLVWTVMGIELVGIVTDLHKLSHGYVVGPPIVWMLIHTAAIVTGYLCLQGARRAIEGAHHAKGSSAPSGRELTGRLIVFCERHLLRSALSFMNHDNAEHRLDP
jgi:hypothetical protein